MGNSRRRQGPWQPGQRYRMARLATGPKREVQERRKRKRQRQRLVGSGRRKSRARSQQKEGESPGEVNQQYGAEADEALGAEGLGAPPVFVGAGIKDLKSAIPCCTTYRSMGCVLAWCLIHSADAGDLIFRIPQWMKAWRGFTAAANLSAARGRNSVFPFREGDLSTFTAQFNKFSLEEVVSPEVVETWSSCAWLYNTISALNKLAGYKGSPYIGRWTSSERTAAQSMRRAIERRCARDVVNMTLTEAAWQKELSGKQIGYNGEEVSVCQQLSWEQVIPSLPPEEHGGSIETLHWVSPRTREFLLNPSLLLKEHSEVQLPNLPGKIHVKAEDKMSIAHELVRRNICTCVPLDAVYQVGSQKVLNGLFGVKKPTCLSSGAPILRLIMNLTGSNSTQHQLEGGASNLPSVTSWQSLVIEQGQSLEMFQSDMSSAFYLFKVPPCWHRHLAFNVVTSEEELMGKGRRLFALCCSVLPMGWLNSVSIMQEVSENILKHGQLNPYNQVSRSNPLPKWFTEILAEATEADRSWWHVYLDNFCACERVESHTAAVAGALCHEAAEAAWQAAGVVSSEKKRVSAASYINELGAEVDGDSGALGVSTQKLLKLALATLWMLAGSDLGKKQAQVIAGRWIFVLQFRRPAMGFLQEAWKVTSGAHLAKRDIKEKAKGEFLALILASPLLHCNMGATVAKQIVCTDASEKAGAVGYAQALTEEGDDFIRAQSKLQGPGDGQPIPVLIVSLFNGIGGSFRAYDVLSLVPAGRIAVEIDEGANRICARRWPGTIFVKDVKKVDRETVRSWSRRFLDIEEVHIWAGFPCADLSSAKYGRQNLLGPCSSLFYEGPRVEQLVKEEFGSAVKVKHVYENVASMDREACAQISAELEEKPYFLNPEQAVPMKRPRLAWFTEKVEGCLPGVEVTPKQHWNEVEAWAPYPSTAQWIRPGFHWEGESFGKTFPTCMKSIPRKQPPPKPAGIQKCSFECLERWAEDSFRYPPYQYSWEFLLTDDKSWRLLDPEEKELLLGYGYNHTILAWSTSQAKRDPQGFKDARHSYLGDSFSVYSFVIMAAACCRRWIPWAPYQHWASRMGVAPGFRMHVRSQAPLSRKLNYGSPPKPGQQMNSVESINKLLLRRTNHTGSDVRMVTGEILAPKNFPRQSVASAWWSWQHGYAQRWKHRSHINVLELETILWGLKFQIQRFKVVDCRVMQLSDSYVSISVVSKGRSSSLQLQRINRVLSAYLLAFGLQLIMAHVESGDNPTDEKSRQ